MTDSLPSCARLHPGVPSVITVSDPIFTGQSIRVHRNCRVCKRLRNLGRAAPAPKAPGAPYGIVKLSWTPPERFL